MEKRSLNEIIRQRNEKPQAIVKNLTELEQKIDIYLLCIDDDNDLRRLKSRINEIKTEVDMSPYPYNLAKPFMEEIH